MQYLSFRHLLLQNNNGGCRFDRLPYVACIIWHLLIVVPRRAFGVSFWVRATDNFRVGVSFRVLKLAVVLCKLVGTGSTSKNKYFSYKVMCFIAYTNVCLMARYSISAEVGSAL